ncbi:hypothetical protein LIT25_23950 [Bacillus sp. F19]|nr:hypothetical protein LIT25_23950 [Bacillus sp. F19]
MTNITEKMIAVITEIAETNAQIWDVFDICDKHMLTSGEEAIVTAMFTESKDEMIKLLQEPKDETIVEPVQNDYPNGFGADEGSGISEKELNEFASIGKKNKVLKELGLM